MLHVESSIIFHANLMVQSGSALRLFIMLAQIQAMVPIYRPFCVKMKDGLAKRRRHFRGTLISLTLSCTAHVIDNSRSLSKQKKISRMFLALHNCKNKLHRTSGSIKSRRSTKCYIFRFFLEQRSVNTNGGRQSLFEIHCIDNKNKQPKVQNPAGSLII